MSEILASTAPIFQPSDQLKAMVIMDGKELCLAVQCSAVRALLYFYFKSDFLLKKKLLLLACLIRKTRVSRV